ncbi:MAG: hypothetical protein KF784_10605 [Fimbriimonadaceae bacterium]|nr:hypothetical protein [Fimbriimonadaceae bacterium]
MPRLFIDWYRKGHFIGFMQDILLAVDPTEDRFEWLVTDVVAHTPDQTWLAEREFSAPTFDLVRAMSEVSVQYQFAVFSAFRLAEAPDPNFLPVYPKIEDRPVLWTPDVEPQHPKALFEILQCDNCYVCAACREDRWLDYMKRCFPGATIEDPFQRPSGDES